MGFNDISMNMWLNSTCELQTDLILKDDASTAKSLSSQTAQGSFENSTHL